MSSTTAKFEKPSQDWIGVIAGVASYVLWGFMPILFRATERAGASVYEIVAWRTIWAVPLMFAFVWATDGGASLYKVMQTPRTLLTLLLSGTLIATNWMTYLLAVLHDQILAASLGYFLSPLVSVAGGALIFRERINRTGLTAIVLAVIGVAIQGTALQGTLWIPLIIAFTFGGYGVVRKKAPVSAQTGLLVECIYLAIPAMAYAAWLGAVGHGVFGRDIVVTSLLILCALATVVPLALFAYAARRLSLTLIGFLQFITPSLTFLCGLAAGEALSPIVVLSFCFIWAGVMAFAAGGLIQSRRSPFQSA